MQIIVSNSFRHAATDGHADRRTDRQPQSRTHTHTQHTHAHTHTHPPRGQCIPTCSRCTMHGSRHGWHMYIYIPCKVSASCTQTMRMCVGRMRSILLMSISPTRRVTRCDYVCHHAQVGCSLGSLERHEVCRMLHACLPKSNAKQRGFQKAGANMVMNSYPAAT